MTMSHEQSEALLARPLVAVLSTVDAAGNPRTAPVWFHWQDGAAYVFTGRTTLKWRNLQRHPYASLCIDEREPPYSGVILDGPIEESDRSLHELVLGMALRYYGEERGRPFAEAYREGGSAAANAVAFKLTPDRVYTWRSDSY